MNPTPNPKIFVIQENNKFDYSGAEKFGDLEFLTRLEYKPYNGSSINTEIQQSVVEGLVDFHPQDYMLLTGNPVTMAYAFHVALCVLHEKGAESINILRWDNMRREYVAIVVPFDPYES